MDIPFALALVGPLRRRIFPLGSALFLTTLLAAASLPPFSEQISGFCQSRNPSGNLKSGTDLFH